MAVGGTGASPDFTDMGGIAGRGSDSGLGSLGSFGGKGRGSLVMRQRFGM